MDSMTRIVVGAVSSFVMAAGIVSPVAAGSRQAAPRTGGNRPGVSAPAHRDGTAALSAAPRGHVTPKGTATGVARYGHSHGGTAWVGRGWWGGGYPWWGVGWYDAWGWPGYGFVGYGPWYPAYVTTAVGGGEGRPQNGPATVVTALEPSRAKLDLDGEPVGFARDYNGRWDRLSVPAGHHTITFRHKGYRSLTIEFDARPGESYAFHDTLTPGDGEERRVSAEPSAPARAEESEPEARAQATGRLRLHVDPDDAAVYLDGAYLGLGEEIARIHGAIAVAVGSHRLEAVRPGYVSESRTIEVGDSGPTIADLVLERAR